MLVFSIRLSVAFLIDGLLFLFVAKKESAHASDLPSLSSFYTMKMLMARMTADAAICEAR